MILTILGVVDIAISINKMVNAKSKVLKEMKWYHMVCDNLYYQIYRCLKIHTSKFIYLNIR